MTPIISGICIFYTTIGGLKAVVWTDTIQLIVMMGAITAVFAIGISDVGGFGFVWQNAAEKGRLNSIIE